MVQTIRVAKTSPSEGMAAAIISAPDLIKARTSLQPRQIGLFSGHECLPHSALLPAPLVPPAFLPSFSKAALVNSSFILPPSSFQPVDPPAHGTGRIQGVPRCRRRGQPSPPSNNRDRCNRRILCRVITWRRGLSGIHQNGAGCGDGEITRCGEGEVLAGGDSAAGSQWPGNEAVLCPGGDFRTPVLLVATNPASARSAPSPSVGGRRGGGLGP